MKAIAREKERGSKRNNPTCSPETRGAGLGQSVRDLHPFVGASIPLRSTSLSLSVFLEDHNVGIDDLGGLFMILFFRSMTLFQEIVHLLHQLLIFHDESLLSECRG